MKTRLKTGLLLCGGVLGGSAAVAAQKQPNILLVLSDDQSAFAVGCYGNADIRTPNLDRFASEGVRFKRAYATSPQSVPSRASIIKQIALFLIVLTTLLPGLSATAQQTPAADRVTMYTFSDGLSDQLQELTGNPLLHRYAQTRERLSSGKYRPLYHFSAPEGRLNDPNGLCYWNGNWHLFYQAYPIENPIAHWGHAYSPDLIHWKDLPIAIAPSIEERVYSGSTLIQGDSVIAMYRGVGQGEMVAVSRDPLLLNWRKPAANPVIPDLDPEKEQPVFARGGDPFLWYCDKLYYAILGGYSDSGPDGKRMFAEYLYRSPDLLRWEYLHPFIDADPYAFVGDDGACPYFYPIGNGDEHILLHFSHKSGGKYLIGNYDTQLQKFIVTDGGNFNHGPAKGGGIHAPSACPDGKGGIVVLFNTNPGFPRKDDFSEMMTLPRLLTWEEGALRVRPWDAVESLRRDHIRLEHIAVLANQETILDGITGDALEISMEIDLGKTKTFELSVLRSPDGQEHTRILFQRDMGKPTREYENHTPTSTITIDNTHGSRSPLFASRPPETAELSFAKGEKLKLRVFIDRSIVEVFVNDRQSVTLRTYPERDDSKGISVRTAGNGAEILSLDAWRMESIWTDASRQTRRSADGTRSQQSADGLPTHEIHKTYKNR